jgi:protein-S-isoprenylcysteine O-methyltransferase Ste14
MLVEFTAMRTEYYEWGVSLWSATLVIWVLGTLASKRTVLRQSAGSRALQSGLTLLAYSLVFSRYFRTGWLATRYMPPSDTVEAAGLVLTFAGLVFAVWARVQLGRNWSGTVTVKEDHQLIRRGPYATVRHPIYTGLLLGILGMALIIGEVRGLVGFAILLVAFRVKSRTEEAFMRQQFGAEYTQYQHDVKALIPFIY